MKHQNEETNINSLETFIELVENDIFKPGNYERIKNDISNQERNALKDIQKDTSKSCHIQKKGSRLLSLIVIVILKRLIANLKEVLFNN